MIRPLLYNREGKAREKREGREEGNGAEENGKRKTKET